MTNAMARHSTSIANTRTAAPGSAVTSRQPALLHADSLGASVRNIATTGRPKGLGHQNSREVSQKSALSRSRRRTLRWPILAFLAIPFASAVADDRSATTTIAPDRELIESLFPPPPAGWRLGAVQVSYAHGAPPKMTMSSTAAGFLSRGVRVTARRRYVSDEDVVVVAIATNDIEGIVRIDAINVASTFSANLRMSLDEAGMKAVEHDGRLGIVVDEPVDRVQVFPVGAAGTVTIRCERTRCGDLLDRLPRLIEWDRIDAMTNSLNVYADGFASGRTVSGE